MQVVISRNFRQIETGNKTYPMISAIGAIVTGVKKLHFERLSKIKKWLYCFRISV